MKAIVFQGIKSVRVMDVPKPTPKEGWALIKVSHAGICGSDLTIYLGAHPRATAPLVMGHEFSGYLESDLPGMPKGTLVTANPLLSCGQCEPCRTGNTHVCKTLQLLGIDCDGGMAEYAVAPIDKIIKVPDNVSPKAAAFIEPVAVTVHAVRLGGFLPGSDALIFGAGAIGMALAVTLREFGATGITICEPNPIRVSFAKSMGFDVLQSDEGLLDQLMARTEGNGYDYVFDCAGHQSVADILPDVVKIRGKIVVVAGYKKPPVMNFQKGMFKEFSLQFVRVYTHKDFSIAAKMVAQQPEYAKIVNYELAPEGAQKGFDLLTSPSDAEKVMFKF